MSEKTFWFKVEGRLYAENEDDATEQLHDALSGNTDSFQITSMEED